MKNNFPVLAVLTALIVLPSCKKDRDQPLNNDEVRLMAIDTKTANGESHIKFQYDGNGRIVKVTSNYNTDPALTIFDITYNGNEARLSRPAFSSAGGTNADTVRMIFDNSRLVQRLEKRFDEYFFPYNDPQRTYTEDTVNYEYNATGLLTKEIKRGWDSTWRNVSNSGTINRSVSHTAGTTEHTINNNNLVSMDGVLTWSFVTKQGVQTVTTSNSTESHVDYQYTQAFVNKTDFSNAAILNELQYFSGIPLNKNYSNVPDKFSSSYIQRDQNGTVYSSNSYTSDRKYTYNSYGFISTLFDPATPDLKTTFVYNK